jgi:hypothetical protein
MKAIQVCLDKVTDPHQRGDNKKNRKYWVGSFKRICSQEPII